MSTKICYIEYKAEVMQKFLGLIFIAVGSYGMLVYPLTEKTISTDDKIAMLLGLVMILFGFIVIYGDR